MCQLAINARKENKQSFKRKWNERARQAPKYLGERKNWYKPLRQEHLGVCKKQQGGQWGLLSESKWRVIENHGLYFE